LLFCVPAPFSFFSLSSSTFSLSLSLLFSPHSLVSIPSLLWRFC
jgi:hypothetical protein